MTQSKMVWWVGHVEHVEKKRYLYWIGLRKLEEKKSLEDRVMDGGILLK